MSKTNGSKDGLSEAFLDVLTNIAKGLFGLGAVVTVLATALLVFLCFQVAGDSERTTQALQNVGILKHVITYGAIGVAVGSSYLYWGEEIAAALLLLASAVLFFAPSWMPFI